jgi:hypothetical protein
MAPKFPRTNFELPLKRDGINPDVELVDVGARRQLVKVWEALEEIDLKETKVLEELITLRLKGTTSQAPTSSKKLTFYGVVIAGFFAACGTVGASIINAKLGSVSKTQQAEMIRQAVQDSVKSTESVYWAGKSDGLQEAKVTAAKEDPQVPIKKKTDPSKTKR